MSVRASTWAWEQIRDRELRGCPALTLLRIADHADSDGLCWPGVAGLSPYCGEESTVRRAIVSHEAEGLLTRRPRQQEQGRGRAADLIQLHLSPLDQPGETPGETEAADAIAQDPATGAASGDRPSGPQDQPGETPGETDHDQPGISSRPTGHFTHDQPGISSPTPITRNRKEPSGNPPRPSGDEGGEDPEPKSWPVYVHRLCDLHCRLVNERTGRKVPYRVTDEWLIEMERLIRLDGRTVAQVEHVIAWVHRDTFWAPNVLSVPKLRQQFDTLLLRSGGARLSAVVDRPAPADIEPDPTAADAWRRAVATVLSTLPPSAAANWIDPLEVLGSRAGKVCVSGPAHAVDWTRRRYGPTLEAAIREGSDFAGFDVFDSAGAEIGAAA